MFFNNQLHLSNQNGNRVQKLAIFFFFLAQILSDIPFDHDALF